MADHPDLSGLDYYRVGGAPRDELLGREPNDEDYVVVGATVDEMVDRGFETMVGEAFPVFLHPVTKDEWALARTEEKTGVGYKGFEIQSGPDVTLEEDLERRDLTINAIAQDPETGEFIDPFGGRDDLDAGIIRHVSEAFAEDPLRVLRAARYAARFGFEVADETRELLREVAPELEAVDNQRIYREILKAMRQADSPRTFFDVLRDVGALDVILPEMAALAEIPAGPEEYHAEGSAFEHSMRVLEEMHALRPNDERALLAAAFHDIGKSQTPDDVLPHHYKHEKRGKHVAEDIADRLEMSIEHRGVLKTAARLHGRMRDLRDLNESTLIRMIDSIRDNYEVSNPGDEPVIAHITPDELVDLAVADNRGREPQGEFDRDHAERLFETTEEILDDVNGGEVLASHDIEEGPHVSDVLLQERVRQLKEKRKEL